jgi:hypothetical protein
MPEKPYIITDRHTAPEDAKQVRMTHVEGKRQHTLCNWGRHLVVDRFSLILEAVSATIFARGSSESCRSESSGQPTGRLPPLRHCSRETIPPLSSALLCDRFWYPVFSPRASWRQQLQLTIRILIGFHLYPDRLAYKFNLQHVASLVNGSASIDTYRGIRKAGTVYHTHSPR